MAGDGRGSEPVRRAELERVRSDVDIIKRSLSALIGAVAELRGPEPGTMRAEEAARLAERIRRCEIELDRRGHLVDALPDPY